MSFEVPPDAYARFMGRFSVPLGVATRDLGLLVVIAATALAGIAFLLALGVSRRRWIAELRKRVAERTT